MSSSSCGYVSKDYVQWGALVDLSDAKMAWNAIDKRARTSIRKGRLMHVIIRSLRQDDPEELAFVRSITPNVEDIPSAFEERHHAFIACDTLSSERLGWILLAGIGSKLFMLCHASTLEGKQRQTPNMLIWHAIETHAGGPYAHVDVGASYRPSLQKYFQGFRQETYPLILRPPEYPMDLRITPFDTQAYGVPFGDPDRGRLYLHESFGTDEYTLFPRAMYAIAACLNELKERGSLSLDDEVCITTTTDSPYISSCVTRAIESVCRWSQTPSERTRAVFLIHEFGFPHPRAATWRAFCNERQIPLIEDLAYGWGSDGTGTWGDYKVYSMTKMFPVQFGGALVGMRIEPERIWNIHRSHDAMKERELCGALDAHGQSLVTIRAERQRVWRLYESHLASVAKPVLPLDTGVLPGAFLMQMHDEDEMRRVSSFVGRFGIEVGNWYHHAAIFLPCHQRMTERHVAFVAGAILANYREGCGVPCVS